MNQESVVGADVDKVRNLLEESETDLNLVRKETVHKPMTKFYKKHPDIASFLKFFLSFVTLK